MGSCGCEELLPARERFAGPWSVHKSVHFDGTSRVVT